MKLSGAIRTQEELLVRCQSATGLDTLGFETTEYLRGMTFETARPLLVDDATGDDWPEPETAEALSARAKDYMEFWLDKIKGERGISAYRASAHFTAWKFMLGHEDWDSFPGSCASPATMDKAGYYQRDAYEYIKAQIDSGEWDELTARP